jgi:Tfp pilus assembly protein PilE
MTEAHTEHAKTPVWPWVLLGCGLLAVVTVPIMAIIAAIAIPSLLAARRSSLEANETTNNEVSAIANCRHYAEAQTIFKRTDWDKDGVPEFAVDFPELCNTKDDSGSAIMLIDTAFAQAKGADGLPKQGYIFYNLESIGGQEIDWTHDFGLCAVPAQYGKTGRRTFIICTFGPVFEIDNMGEPVTDWPSDLQGDGWRIAK